jgi:hypothetical protein
MRIKKSINIEIHRTPQWKINKLPTTHLKKGYIS